MPRSLLGRACWILLGCALLPPPCAAWGSDGEPQLAVIRVLPPEGRVAGRVEIETLSSDPEILRVVFLLDGEEVAKRNRVPFKAKLLFADPPREQTLEVRAYGTRDRLLGRDSLSVNRERRPLRVRITTLEHAAETGELAVAAEVSVPRKASLDRLEWFLNGDLRTSLEGPPYESKFKIEKLQQTDLVRAVATLRDGRIVEDVKVVGAPFSDEIEVNLVQLQVLVTKKNGALVTDLELEDFELREAGEVKPIDRLYPAEGVALVLGLVLDSSGSMLPIWDLTTRSASQFLHRTLGPRDRAFLVDFDTRLSLVRPLTGDIEELVAGMAEIEPDGGTALYDSVLYSMLQFTDEPGRRALIVLTDGVDASSTSNPKRAVEFGRRLGVPVYVVALPWPNRRGPAASSFARSYSSQELRLLTDPTGGRLIRTASPDGIARAFSQINLELRHQYVLTFYSDLVGTDRRFPALELTVKGRRDVEVRAVVASDLSRR